MSRVDYTNKNSVRKFFLKKRSELNEQDVIQKSANVKNRLLNTKVFKKAKSVHTYVSIRKNNEVQTKSFIKSTIQNGTAIIVPKMISGGELQHYQIQSIDELQVNSWGVPEPVTNNEQYSLKDIDLVLVPMVAGDRLKNRIGYGKGYYDRFLSKIDVYKIGLLFQCQLSEKPIPAESFDVKLDMLITENEVIS